MLLGSVQWTRKKSIQLFNVYAHDVSYPNRNELNAQIYKEIQERVAKMGRIPWVVGGDFNQEPQELLPGWSKSSHIFAPSVPTRIFGRVIDWFMASPLLGSNLRANVVHGQGVHGHIPVILTIPTYRALDLGVSIKKQKKIYF
jgi:hypothetical protein